MGPFHWQDVRYALRLLARSPVFTLLTVLVLAGGLGVAIFTFSFLRAAMLAPLPVEGGDRIVRLEARTAAGSTGLLDAADLAAIRGGVTTLTDLGAWTGREVVVGSGERARPIQAVAAEWTVFPVTRTRPMLGRGLRPDDQAPGAEPVAVLSEWTWRAVFDGDAAILDRVVTLSGTPTRIVGVMPAGYGFPVAAEAWLPIRSALLSSARPGEESVGAWGRLAPGADAASARAELTALLAAARADRPRDAAEGGAPAPPGIGVVSFPMAQIGDEGPLAFGVLNALAALILALAAVNVTNLLLARANERARETAVRLALGAPRARLVVQNMWESVILCLAGGALATALATWALSAVDAWARTHLEGNLPFWWAWGFDRGVVCSAGAFVTACVAALGGVAALRAARTELHAVLQEGGARAGGLREGRVARTLVVAQVSTVTVLLFFGTLSAIVAWRVVNVDLGYDTRNLLAASVDLPAQRYPDAAARGRAFERLHADLEAAAPLDGALLRTTLAEAGGSEGAVELDHPASDLERPRAYVLGVLGSTAVLGVDVRQGRGFDGRDGAGGEPAAIVSRAFASKSWPGRSPVGRRVRLAGLGDGERWRTVVGVVDDVLLGNPISRNRSAVAVYVPLTQSAASGATVLFRHRGGEGAARAAFHATLARLDPELVPSNVASFADVLAKTSLIARAVAALFGGCFAFALLLATSGTYGLMARAIGRRTRELGVRRALGATDGNVVGMLVGQGGRQLGVGALLALPVTGVIAWGFARFFPVALGVSAAAAIAVSAAIGAIVMLATWIPARRAVRIPVREALGRE